MTAGGSARGWSPCLRKPQTSSLSEPLPRRGRGGRGSDEKGEERNGKIKGRNVLPPN